MSSKDPKRLLASAEMIFSPEAVQNAVSRVAQEVRQQLAQANPLVLCVMTGGVVFAGQLLPQLDFPLDFDYLHVTRYGLETQGGKLSWRSAPWTPVKGRTVLVVDDILDEGVTLAAIKDSLSRLGAASVLTAVFADKQHGRTKPTTADFVALQVPDRYVFGFGMDVHGFWRNLPAVYALKDEE